MVVLEGPVTWYDVGGLGGMWTPSLEWGQERGRASWLAAAQSWLESRRWVQWAVS